MILRPVEALCAHLRVVDLIFKKIYIKLFKIMFYLIKIIQIFNVTYN